MTGAGAGFLLFINMLGLTKFLKFSRALILYLLKLCIQRNDTAAKFLNQVSAFQVYAIEKPQMYQLKSNNDMVFDLHRSIFFL